MLGVAVAGCGGDADTATTTGPRTAAAGPSTTAARPAIDPSTADRLAYLRIFQDANGRLARDAPGAQQRLLAAGDAASVRTAARDVRDVMRRFADDIARGRPPGGAIDEHRRVVARTRELAAAYVPLFDGSSRRTSVGPGAADDPALRRVTRLGDLWQTDLQRLGAAVADRPGRP